MRCVVVDYSPGMEVTVTVTVLMLLLNDIMIILFSYDQVFIVDHN